jgi:hypothetical protein
VQTSNNKLNQNPPSNSGDKTRGQARISVVHLRTLSEISGFEGDDSKDDPVLECDDV